MGTIRVPFFASKPMSSTPTQQPTEELPATPPPPAAVEQHPADVARLLKAHFPGLFAGPLKPLKLRIQADIQSRAPGVFTKQALSAFLRRHTGATAYLIALTKASHRFDLDGQPGDELNPEHRQAALDELARRRAIHAEKRALEAQTQAQQQAQAESERRARAGLLRDFERTTLTLPNFCALKGLEPAELDHLLAIARKEAAEAPPPPPQQPPRGRPGDAERPPRGDGPRAPEGRNRPPRPQADRGAPRTDRPQGGPRPATPRPAGTADAAATPAPRERERDARPARSDSPRGPGGDRQRRDGPRSHSPRRSDDRPATRVASEPKKG